MSNIIYLNRKFGMSLKDRSIISGVNHFEILKEILKNNGSRDIVICLSDRLIKDDIIEYPIAAGITASKKMFRRIAERLMDSRDVLYSETPLHNKNNNIGRTKISAISNKDALMYKEILSEYGARLKSIIPEEELFSGEKTSVLMVFKLYSFLLIKDDEGSVISRNLPIVPDGIAKEVDSTINYVKQKFKVAVDRITIYNFSGEDVAIGVDSDIGDIDNITMVDHIYGDILNNNLFKHSVVAARVAKIASAVLVAIPFVIGGFLWYQVNLGAGGISPQEQARYKTNIVAAGKLDKQIIDIKKKSILSEANKKFSRDTVLINILSNIGHIVDSSIFNLDILQLNIKDRKLNINMTLRPILKNQQLVSDGIADIYSKITSPPYNIAPIKKVSEIQEFIPEAINERETINIKGVAYVY